MVSFFIYSSHREAEEALHANLWGEGGIESSIDASFEWKRFGTEIRSILVGIYAEGAIPVNAPSTPRVGNVSRKDKSLRIDIAVDPLRVTSSDLRAVRTYLVEAIAAGLRTPLTRRNWDFDFEKLAKEFEQI